MHTFTSIPNNIRCGACPTFDAKIVRWDIYGIFADTFASLLGGVGCGALGALSALFVPPGIAVDADALVVAPELVVTASSNAFVVVDVVGRTFRADASVVIGSGFAWAYATGIVDQD